MAKRSSVFIAALIAVVIGLGLTACGSGGGSSDSGNNNGGQENQFARGYTKTTCNLNAAETVSLCNLFLLSDNVLAIYEYQGDDPDNMVLKQVIFNVTWRTAGYLQGTLVFNNNPIKDKFVYVYRDGRKIGFIIDQEYNSYGDKHPVMFLGNIAINATVSEIEGFHVKYDSIAPIDRSDITDQYPSF